ncbi:TVP38/TMEM64 family protein [Merismopedia glauca]|uniref:TVP38/TMEM64 family membrane protein n=1 Tax=Merismopedia glauca CCAP 1448/3 TaxID=1296344 RepID=A0A2T1C8R5_9CYAN|nr:TVP38/TMEM64 family protein [Merismopedia glauca]PSB04639.1 TVP38/TMEM64 family protein [Merismopedia glauca CCAP 1448/3]
MRIWYQVENPPISKKPFFVTQLWKFLRRYYPLLFLVGIVLVFWFTPLRQLLNKDFLTDELQKWGFWAVPIFVLTYIIVTVLGLPITAHTLAGGVLFGIVWGTIWSTIGATLGAIAAFCLVRYWLQNWAMANFGSHKLLANLNQAVDSRPFNLTLALRFAPIAPFNLINFLLGLTTIDLKVYSLATLIGVIPGTIAYTWLGITGTDALQGKDKLNFAIALLFFTFISLLPFLMKRRGKRESGIGN